MYICKLYIYSSVTDYQKKRKEKRKNIGWGPGFIWPLRFG